MIKRILSLFAAVILCVAVLPINVTNTYAAKNYAKGFDGDTSKSIILDNSGIFSSHASLFDELDWLVKEYSEKLQMNIFIYVSGTYISDEGTEIYADDTYDEWFGEDTDGVFYYLDLSGKRPAYDYISTSGRAVLAYEQNINSIFRALDAYLPASGETVYVEDIYEAIKAFLMELEYYSSDDGMKYYHDSSSGKYIYYSKGELKITKIKPPFLLVQIAVVGIIIGALVAVICYFVIKSKYKFKGSCDAQVYLSHQNTRYAENSDALIKTYVTKSKIESSSSGSGRSGGGGGGHSHSGGHGGGGHHR